MQDDKKFGQFEAAFESGQEGQVSDYDAWLESHGFEPERVGYRMIREHLRDNPEKTVDYDEPLQSVGEFAGHFAANGGTIHIPVTGVSGVGKTQFRLTVEAALDRLDTDFDIQSHSCPDFADEVEFESSGETLSRQKLYDVADKVSDSDYAVFIIDDCGKDKRVAESMETLDSATENTLFVTFWTPESWGRDRDQVESEIGVTKQFKLSGLTASQCSNLAKVIAEFIGGEEPISEDTIRAAFEYSNGVPYLFIHTLVGSLKQAFLGELEPWDEDTVHESAEKRGLTDMEERLKSLSQAKLQYFRHMLVHTGTGGIRPKKLVELLDKDKSTVSYHLNELSSLGFVESKTEGRSARYSVDNFIKPLIQMRLEKEVETNV